MLNIDFQRIYDLISESLPSDWEEIVLYCISINGSYEVSYFVKRVDIGYKECFDLGMPFEDIIGILSDLCELFVSDTMGWRSITVKINSSSEFNSIADYSSESISYENYLSNWKKQYLI